MKLQMGAGESPPTRPDDRLSVALVGGGPIGLFTARALARDGHNVTIVYEHDPSMAAPTYAAPVAAGLIEPVAVAAEDAALVQGLFAAALPAWLTLSARTDLGVDRRTVLFRPAATVPDWLHSLGDRRLNGDYTFDSAVVTPALFLPRMRQKLADRGVRFVRSRVDAASLERMLRGHDVVILAAGSGSYRLGDEACYGRRGVMVWTRPHARMNIVRFDEASFTYGIPQRHRVGFGGTDDEFRGGPDTWPTTVPKGAADDILDRLPLLHPDLHRKDLTILDVTVGYRPARPRIRLEADPGRPGLVWATGFGGSGWTLAPAVASRAVGLAMSAAASRLSTRPAITRGIA